MVVLNHAMVFGGWTVGLAVVGSGMDLDGFEFCFIGRARIGWCFTGAWHNGPISLYECGDVEAAEFCCG
jgi:hypothetical protein